jgi:hypothetical protein
MGEVSTIGLDFAKSVFQVHGVDVDGRMTDACAPLTPRLDEALNMN